MNILKDRFPIAALILLALWIYSAMPALKAEWLGIRLASELSGISYDERASIVGGPVYPIAQAVMKAAVDGQGAKVYFIAPSEPDGTGPVSGRARYYLYPMDVRIESGEGFDVSKIRSGDFVCFYLPGQAGSTQMEMELKDLLTTETVFEKDDATGRSAAYKVMRGV
ncbi:MAG: hypothetical protein AABY51_05405 [Deltaproteobacteria bacterium]